MGTQDTQQADHDVVEQNTKRIDKLIQEVEKLVCLLEQEHLVEPEVLIQLAKELHAIRSGE